MAEPESKTVYKEKTEEVLPPEAELPPEAAAQARVFERERQREAAAAGVAAMVATRLAAPPSAATGVAAMVATRLAAEQKKKTRPPKDPAETKKMELITKILTEFRNFTGDALYVDYTDTDLNKLNLEELEEFKTIMDNVKGIFANIIEPALRERFKQLMKKANHTIDHDFFSNENLIQEILTDYSALMGKDLYDNYTGTDLNKLNFEELQRFQTIMNIVQGNFAAIKNSASRQKFKQLMEKANHTIGENFFSQGGKRRTKRRHRKGTKKSKRSKKKSKKSKKRSKRRH